MKENLGLRVAVEGCCHGELDKIYNALENIERVEQVKIDLLICCGDFQAVRNKDDLECMAAPFKYREMKTFYKYYSGEKIAPYPTLFIGGNHEAINYLRELFYGGWVAPNIYFLGYAGVINFGGIRIAGLSGIYKSKDYHYSHFESLPYTESTLRSSYHVREIDVFRLKQINQKLDVLLSHDWPLGVEKYGRLDYLLKVKPWFKEDIDTNSLGNPGAAELLNVLKPKYHFSAHLHVKYEAEVKHENTNEITKFLALDKCLPNRSYLQIIDFPDARGEKKFHYDEEWLLILRKTHKILKFTSTSLYVNIPRNIRNVTNEDKNVIERNFKYNGLKIPNNFIKTAKSYVPETDKERGNIPFNDIKNPQTQEFLNKLNLDYNLNFGSEDNDLRGNDEEGDNYKNTIEKMNENDLKFDNIVFQEGSFDGMGQLTLDFLERPSRNPEEISIFFEDGFTEDIISEKDLANEKQLIKNPEEIDISIEFDGDE